MIELILLAAAFLAGAMNAVAGGGSFLTLPALIYAGVPPVAANATGTVALLPGYASGVYGYRQDLTPVGTLSLPLLSAVSLVGGLVGAGLLLVTPDSVFRGIVPWLLLLATGLFAFGNMLAQQLRSLGLHGNGAMLGTLFAVSVYGGYFNGGLGILLLAQLSLFGMTDLNAMNGLKNLFSAVLTAIAVVAYAAGGAVEWPKALLMVVAAVAGGYVGARLGRKIPKPILRTGIIAVGLVMSAVFFLK
ncbi:sulfite exporter TauE/SafE family protein (plasmid) [Azospirillum oryzae]|uniref:Probable membrane transporter protein n=1 Tax=Azospirillum oryzae TaxID=286727 RepID=A0A6N1AZH0_9PROT|nr:sulfite exporter TauE/SafE family protein [Azospirillum oryzae]KAA0585230.1 sulfite exporter TauE/SafE family protein [Azospirillum oryzae]QKS54474.1 sulfite exporter TauE/SafE family protein [Azospirillum oryzae]